MKLNNHPLFALLPPEALLKAKTLAEQFHLEHELEDLVGRRVFTLTVVIVSLLIANGAIGFIFCSTAIDLLPTNSGWPKLLIGTYSLFVWIGGTLFMFEALIAWLEVLVLRQVFPDANPGNGNARLYRPRTWLPLIPLSLVPMLFNVWFSLPFFLVSVSVALAIVLLLPLLSDV